jgi:hypothetical protein
MPNPAEVAHALTDATIAYIAASVPLVVSATVALAGVVFSCLAWLCYAELRGRARASHITNSPGPSTDSVLTH